MLSGHLRETIMRVYDTRPTTAKSIMDIAEMVDSVAKREYSRGRKDQSEKSIQWIPCSKRLPEKVDIYLVSTEGISVNVAFYSGNGKWETQTGLTEVGIDAWQQLPEPYREDET